MSMNTVPERLAALRAAMKANGVDVYLIPVGDPHSSEYLPDHYMNTMTTLELILTIIQLLSGLAVTVIVLMQSGKSAGPWNASLTSWQLP